MVKFEGQKVCDFFDLNKKKAKFYIKIIILIIVISIYTILPASGNYSCLYFNIFEG
jgi:hypothetical protein